MKTSKWCVATAGKKWTIFFFYLNKTLKHRKRKVFEPYDKMSKQNRNIRVKSKNNTIDFRFNANCSIILLWVFPKNFSTFFLYFHNLRRMSLLFCFGTIVEQWKSADRIGIWFRLICKHLRKNVNTANGPQSFGVNNAGSPFKLSMCAMSKYLWFDRMDIQTSTFSM